MEFAECTMDETPCPRESTLPQRTSCTASRIMDISPTRQLANILDSSPSGLHVLYAFIQLCSVQQELPNQW